MALDPEQPHISQLGDMEGSASSEGYSFVDSGRWYAGVDKHVQGHFGASIKDGSKWRSLGEVQCKCQPLCPLCKSPLHKRNA